MQSICLIICSLVVMALGESDLEALLVLKKGFQKDPSGQVIVSWDSKSIGVNGCPLNWYGINCTDGRVTSITLNDLGLFGDFSFDAISSLNMLRELSISNNQLMGRIPKVGSMVSLELLDISRNSFHGLMPSDFQKLENLVLLKLSSNNFEGTIPTGFENLDKLKYLDLRENGFSGDIMGLLSELGAIFHVDLSINRFSGSLDIGLGNSSFVSTIQYLNVSHNLLAGELFQHDGMPYFDNLEVFDASNNQLQGSVPSFNFVVSLRILRLGSNRLSESLPEALLQESSTMLSELDLSLNQLEGPVGSITSETLKSLNLSSNKLSGSLPTKVGRCAIIDLSNNMLSGNLSRLQGWGNYVEVIELSSNSLTGTLPNQTSQFLRLTSFRIANNSIEGALPLMLGTYPELGLIDLSLNQLDGELLPSFFTSTKFTILNLSRNNFSGPIPIQATTNVSSVVMTGNHSLLSLDLSYNSLSGQIPSEISKFQNLVYLDLSCNKLEGNIPEDFSDVLTGFNVSYNNLSGVVPGNLRRFPDSSFHPGNSMLVLPYSPSSAKGVPNLTPRGRGSHTKTGTRVAVIAGLVGGAVVMALLLIMIIYKAHWEKCNIRSVERNGKSTGADQRNSSSPKPSPFHGNLDQSLSSSRIPQDHKLLPSTAIGLVHEHGGSSSVVERNKGFIHSESLQKDEGLSSPMSLLSSLNPPPSQVHHTSGIPVVLKVSSPDKLVGDLHLFDSSLLFTAEELSCAPAEIIGTSCHGKLYRASLQSGHVLAVKWLREGIAKGKKEFAREAKKLGNIKHPNLVTLQGYYWGPKEHEKLLISSYISAPSLALYLHDTEPRRFLPLSFAQRLKIAVDISHCLNYLHSERAIPHGNLKSTNILLEMPKLNALLTDYSLHRIMTPVGIAEQVLTSGALGYRPPEFSSSYKPCPSLKSDVYAFGVILLELLTGKNPGALVPGNLGVVDLTDWVVQLARENRSRECFDRLILGDYSAEHPPKVFEALLNVALACILPASERPDMKSIFEDISSIALQ